MTSRSHFQVPPRPQALQHSSPLPYWGERRPPKDFADVFHAYAAKEDTGSSGSDTRTVATLRIYGPIYDGWFGISARNVSEALDELGDVDEIRVRINSPGGDAWEGMTILNMLRAHPAEVVAVVDGIAASAASYVAAGCDQTVMSPGTQLMIHDASALAFGPAETMRKAATFLDSVSNAIASVYADVAGGQDSDWRALMVETTWYTAAEAVEAGLADRVGIVLDAGPSDTAADEEPPDLDESDVEDSWDLSMYPYAGRSKAPAPKSPTASAGGSTHTEGGPAVAFSDEQLTTMRQQLGVPEDADEAAILAALEEALEERAEPTAASPTAELPEGMVLVDSTVLAELRSGAEAGRTARQELDNQARDRAIADAIAAGKTTPTRRKHWVTAWAADPEGTRALLDSLEPGLVPTDELGHGDEPDTDDALYASVFGDQKGA